MDVLKEVRNAATVGPVLIHVITEKGRGYVPAETASDKMHGVVTYDIVTGKQKKKVGGVESYTNIFADALVAEAEADSRVLAIHAAMAGGTGLSRCAAAHVVLIDCRICHVCLQTANCVMCAVRCGTGFVPALRRDRFCPLVASAASLEVDHVCASSAKSTSWLGQRAGQRAATR